MGTKIVLVPCYYTAFKCKCGACRSCCCTGWSITVSYTEYCALLGLSCKKALRNKLDGALSVLSDADEQRYAVLHADYQGKCPLQDGDGLCRLQKELGEKALPLICRMYPRSVCFDGIDEAACANSCEAVAELLIRMEEPMTFTEVKIEVPEGSLTVSAEEKTAYIDLQRQAAERLQNRTLSFPERMVRLGELLAPYSERSKEQNMIQPSPQRAIQAVLELIRRFTLYSENFANIAEMARACTGRPDENGVFDLDETVRLYAEGTAELYRDFPLWERYMEQIMMNHLVYERFPKSGISKSLWDEYTAFCGVYAVTKFIITAYTFHYRELSRFADCIAGLFRCFEHSDANTLISKTLQSLHFTSLSDMTCLVGL